MSINSQINHFNIILQKMEEDDADQMSPELKEVRHRIMFVHLKIEQALQITLIRNITQLEIKKENLVKISNDFKRISPILDAMEFNGKLKVVEQLNLLPEKLPALFRKVNDYRVHFSHPATFRTKIEEYKNPSKQLQILKDLCNAMEQLIQFLLKNKLYIPTE